jgi:orotate phosphoribosyltransferase
MTSVAGEVLHMLRQTQALLEGHFLLTSGAHSDRYVQCARLLQHPQHAERLGRWIAERLGGTAVDVVASPALGGIIIGQEVARALGVRGVFCEREQGTMTLRRGLELSSGERVLVVEDVVTTGGSVREVVQVVRAQQAHVVGVGVILDRSGGNATFGVPFYALATEHLVNYAPETCPLCQQGGQPIKPGSRQS